MKKKLNIISKNSSKKRNEDELILEKLIFFVKKNLRFISIGVLLILVVPAYFYIIKPKIRSKNKQAQTEMFRAIYDFEAKNYELALNGDDNSKGLIQIAKEYKNTKSGQLANFYIGVIYLNTKEYLKSIDHLKKFKIKDLIIYPRALSLLGDANSELKKYKLAANYYIKAANYKPDNVFAPRYLKKAAINLLKENNKNEAIDCFKIIINKYPDCDQAKEAYKRLIVLDESPQS